MKFEESKTVEQMDDFTRRMKRKWNAVKKNNKQNNRQSRAKKTRQFERDAEDDLSLRVPESPQSGRSNSVTEARIEDGIREHSQAIALTAASTDVPAVDSTFASVDQLALESSIGNDTETDHATLGQQEQQEGENHRGDSAQPDVPVDEEIAQSQRDATYIGFNGEDETDYTRGPARVVFASDGVSSACASLLMTLQMSQSLQKAIMAHRAYAKLERTTEEKRRTYLRFESEVEGEIRNHNQRLRHYPEDGDASKKVSLQEERNNLDMMLQGNENEQRNLQRDLENEAKVLRELQREANAAIEEAFICAHLLEPEDDTPDTPVEDLDIQKEYKKFVTPSIRSGGESAKSIVARDLDISREHKRASHPYLTEEQLRERDLVEAVDTAEYRLQQAQVAFDRGEADRAQEQFVYAEALVHGEAIEDVSPEAFDLR